MRENHSTILVVDDSHDTLDLLEVFLYAKYEIVTALNGFEAFEKAREIIPDLIITDIMMPVMDGIALFNKLCKEPETKDIPVIAVTSFVKKSATKSLLNIGFRDVVAKPLDKEAILGTVKKALKKNNTRVS